MTHKPTLRSHTHWQAPRADTQTKACQRVCLPYRTDDRKEQRRHNRVARPTQNYVGRGSHTTVHADLAYGGSWCKRVAHESLFRTDFLVVVEHGFITALG